MRMGTTQAKIRLTIRGCFVALTIAMETSA
jgi:hypothetical protein